MNSLNILLKNITKNPLLIGKGPSFNLIEKINLNNFYTISLNHVIKYTSSDAVSIIDIDVVRDCEEELYNNAKNLIIPWHPHDKNNDYKPCKKTILDYCQEIDILNKMHIENRIYTYNASSSKVYGLKDNKQFPDYNVFINNGDSVFGILASNNFEIVYSIGIDGGNTYDNAFSQYTPCGNGRSFQESLNMINKISNSSKSKLIRLN